MKDINGKEIVIGDWILWDWFLDTNRTRVHVFFDNVRIANIDEILLYKLER
jgi:hypothetical protein